jgi:hypothetical protein
MQFTRNREITSLLELPFCREALGKNLGFAMWSLGALPARSDEIPAGWSPKFTGGGWGGGLGATRGRFGVLDRGGAAPASGSPAAREGWPLRLPVSGEGGSGKTTGGSVGLGRG